MARSVEDAMGKIRSFCVFAVACILAPGLTFAQQRGSGHTTLPVGNFGGASILPSGQVITPTAPSKPKRCERRPDVGGVHAHFELHTLFCNYPGQSLRSPVDPNLVPACSNPSAKISPVLPELHDAEWWAANLKNFNFHDADRLDTAAFNRILWQGSMGNVPYPTVRSGLDLRKNRAQLLKKWYEEKKEFTSIPEARVASR
jgi:hypothetical protein